MKKESFACGDTILKLYAWRGQLHLLSFQSVSFQDSVVATERLISYITANPHVIENYKEFIVQHIL